MHSGSKLIFMPRTANAGTTFAVFKIFLLLCFLTYHIYLTIWTWYTMKYFQQEVDRHPDTHLVAINKTHKHFFLFTGLFIGASVAIGLWGVLKEYSAVIVGFIVMTGLGFAFEAVGAWKSKSDTVLGLKIFSAVPELVLMVIALIFCLMIRHAEKRLANLPVYRQKMAESRKSSFVNLEDAAKGVDNPGLTPDEEALHIGTTGETPGGHSNGTSEERTKTSGSSALPVPEFKGKALLEPPKFKLGA